MNRRDAFQEAVLELIVAEKEMVCVSVDSASRFKEIKACYPERFIECGICEQTGMSICAGFALQGMIPVISGYATFLTMRAFEQIRTDICKWSLNVKICGTDTGFSPQYAGFTHQALEDIALLSSLDNITVAEACDYQDALLMSKHLFGEVEGPVYLRFGARGKEWVLDERHRPVRIGYFEPLSRENFDEADVTIIALGQLVRVGLEVAEVLEKEGIKTFVFNARFVKPLARKMIEEIASGSKLVISIEEHSVTGGLGDNLLRAFHEMGRVPRLLKFGVPGNFGISGKRDYLLQKSGLSVDSIARRILSVC